MPAIFFFLFPPQLFLFINPDQIITWIEEKRRINSHSIQNRLIYDGQCGFCRASIKRVGVADLFLRIKFIDFHQVADFKELHPQLTREKCLSQMYLIETDGCLCGGFEAFRRLCLILPMFYILIPIVYLPGMGIVGPRMYQWVAKNRYLLHFSKLCKDNACFR